MTILDCFHCNPQGIFPNDSSLKASDIFIFGIPLDAASKISTIVIAIANLLLAIYVVLYQRKRNSQVDYKTAQLTEQTIRLQWFKDLIFQPNREKIDNFYSQLDTLRSKIVGIKLTDDSKQELNRFIKDELSIIRKSFIEAVLQIDNTFGDQIKKNFDGVVDNITETIFNDELKIEHPIVYEREIGSKITLSRNSLFSDVFNYKANIRK